MDPAPNIAEELPTLYRAVLDRVADLEASGRRPEALHVRADATRVYSGSWDEGARRRLVSLSRRADRVLAGAERARTARPSRSSGLGRGTLATR